MANVIKGELEMVKRTIRNLLLILLIVLWSGWCFAVPMTMEWVYIYIRNAPMQQLSYSLRNNDLLEIQDRYGNTPLCKAIMDRDQLMVQKLILLGANLNAWCMNYIPIEDLRSFGLTRRGVNAGRAYSPYQRRYYSMPSVFTRKNLFALGVIGGIAGAVALVAGLSGGGGKKGVAFVGESSHDVLDVSTTIPATQYPTPCPDGMRLINGVCTKVITPGADGTEAISAVHTEEPYSVNSPYYLAEFGGSVANKKNVSYSGSVNTPIVAMQANGVSKDALSGDIVYLSKASSAINQRKASITMTEDSVSDKGVIAMYGTSAGTINNNGSINIISKSDAESAAMKVDRDDGKGIWGIGANITNDGTISIIDEGDGTGTLSAINAPGRSVTNKGKIDILLDAPEGVTINEDTKGSVYGLYGKNISNVGTINLTTNAVAGNTSNTEAYLIRGYGDTGSIVSNDGTININLTNIAWGIYGVWSTGSANTGVSISNTGIINVEGILYNDSIQSKQVYLLGTDGGVSDIVNTGSISVGKYNPVDVSMGGIMSAIYGFSGTLSNYKKLNFNLYADPNVSTGSFSALAMSLNKGTLINQGDVSYYFTNSSEGVTSTKQVIELTAINSSSAEVQNSAAIEATLNGVAAGGSSFTAMSSTNGTMTNTGSILVKSNMNNMSLMGMTTNTGGVFNEKDGWVVLETTGYNADLTGASAKAGGQGVNKGRVYLVHDGGSGNISGWDGGNTGVIQIEAKNMENEFKISGGRTYASITETGEESDVENTTDASGMINISLTGTTAGSVYGYEYYGTKTNIPSYVSANTINITANDKERQGDLSVYGIKAQTFGRAEEDDPVVFVERDGTITLNVMGSSAYSTKVVGLSATDASITNNAESVVNLNVNLNNSTSHSIIGMESLDTNITYDKDGNAIGSMINEFKIWNDGTLNLNVKGFGANILYDSNVPFDVVGMVTNSYALNTGTININVDSLAARTAGMVAYDGGMIINQGGTISFIGNAKRFVPMYATGSRTINSVTRDSSGSDSYTKKVTNAVFYATIYNSGNIIIYDLPDKMEPKGEGYYSTDDIDPLTPATDLWAKTQLDTYYNCKGDDCEYSYSRYVDTLNQFTHFPEKEEDKTKIDDTTTIPATVNSDLCPDGMELINGVCTEVITPGATGEEPITAIYTESPYSEDSPYQLAEFGASITNKENLLYSGDSTVPVVAMQANGVRKDALMESVVYLGRASSVLNDEKASIIMSETSDSDKGVFALYGTSAGTVNNDGVISITSKSNAESAAIKVDRVDTNLDGQHITVLGNGANITNNGTITVIDEGDGTGTLSAISAPGRSVINNGEIDIILKTVSESMVSADKGMAQGIYGQNILNAGTMSLSTNVNLSDLLINTDVYMLRGYGDEGSIIANDGTINIDLTNVAWGVYGVWSDGAAEEGTTISNTGTINVSGVIYNDSSNTLAKQVYLMGTEGGVANITNSGSINVGKEEPLDVSLGGVMNAMVGYSGNMVNSGNIYFNMTADPATASNSFATYVMSQNRGTLENKGDIEYLFSNEKEGVTATNQKLNLVAINTAYATATNSADIRANLSGVAALDSYFVPMVSEKGSLTNAGLISANSNMDNMDMAAMMTDNVDATIVNDEHGQILLKTSGYNADLYGIAGTGQAINKGEVYLIHNGGSGNIVGFGGGNEGLIQIEANDLSGGSRISGAAMSAGGSASGTINISLTGETSGVVYGYEVVNKSGDSASSSAISSTINITANDTRRVGDLAVYGIALDNQGRDEETDPVPSVERNGAMTINVAGSPDYSTEVVGLSAMDSNITNTEPSVVNLNVDLNNSTSHAIIGMESYDTSINADSTTQMLNKYTAWNDGTINIRVSGPGANETYNSDFPFDVIGILTNSRAVNSGEININMESSAARAAGMVAYDGGTIINEQGGTIRFSGTATRFVPFYATGSKTKTEETEGEPDDDGKYVKKEKTTTFYATVYNEGTIIVENTDDKKPRGDCYYSEYIDPEEGPIEAQTVINKQYECVGTECTQVDPEDKDFDNRNKFERRQTSTVLPASASQSVTFLHSNANVGSVSNISFGSPELQNTNVNESNDNDVINLRINEGMRYVTEAGGSFIAEGMHLLGDVTAGTTLVKGKNSNTYLASGSGNGALVGDGDFSDLGLTSNSAMFNASYRRNETNPNGIDIEMKRKSFYELVKNPSLAAYLERNYMLGGSVEFFDKLKSFNQLNSLMSSLNSLSGQDVLSRFNFEDMSMMRELNYDINDKLFHNQEDIMSVSGQVKSMAFKGDQGSSSKYSLYNKRQGDVSVGLGVAFSNVRSNDETQDNKRQETMYQMILPIGFKKFGFDFVSSPRIGYARGTYTRSGFDSQTYKGTLEKKVFGLTNEVRYPTTFGSWTLEPSVEFNVLGYNQRGNEGHKQYSLDIKSQNTYSVESGIGLHISNTMNLSKNKTLKLSAGIVAYHEFADPYRLDVGLTGMDGFFTLRDENRSQNRAVARAGFDYQHDDLSAYASFISYMDKEIHSSIKSGLKKSF